MMNNADVWGCKDGGVSGFHTVEIYLTIKLEKNRKKGKIAVLLFKIL